MADNIVLLNKKIEYLDSIDVTKKLKMGMQTDIDFSKLQSLNDKYSLKVRQICDAFYASGNAIESALFVEDVIKRVFEKEIQRQAKELVKKVPELELEVIRLKGQLNAMTQNTVEFQISQETGHLSKLKEEASKIFSDIVSKEINSFQHNMKILSSDMNNMMASWKTLPQKAKRFTELNKSDENGEEDENKTKSKGENMERFVGKNKEIKEETNIRTSIQENKSKKEKEKNKEIKEETKIRTSIQENRSRKEKEKNKEIREETKIGRNIQEDKIKERKTKIARGIKEENRSNEDKNSGGNKEIYETHRKNKDLGIPILYKNQTIMLPKEERLSLDNKNFGKPSLIRSVFNPVSRPDEKLWRELDQSEITFDDWYERVRIKEFLSNDEVRPHDDRMCQGEWWMQKNVNIRLRLRRKDFVSV